MDRIESLKARLEQARAITTHGEKNSVGMYFFSVGKAMGAQNIINDEILAILGEIEQKTTGQLKEELGAVKVCIQLSNDIATNLHKESYEVITEARII